MDLIFFSVFQKPTLLQVVGLQEYTVKKSRGNPMSPYQQAKQAKRQAQRQAFHAVLALPRRVQGATLFALWPEKLPKVVRHEIDQETRQAWLVAKKRDLSVFRHAV